MKFYFSNSQKIIFYLIGCLCTFGMLGCHSNEQQFEPELAHEDFLDYDFVKCTIWDRGIWRESLVKADYEELVNLLLIINISKKENYSKKSRYEWISC